MKKVLVVLMDVELNMIMACRTVEGTVITEEVFNTFDELCTEYVDDWKDLSDTDKTCYFDTRGYGDTDYVVQWFAVDEQGSFDNEVKI